MKIPVFFSFCVQIKSSSCYEHLKFVRARKFLSGAARLSHGGHYLYRDSHFLLYSSNQIIFMLFCKVKEMKIPVFFLFA